MPDMPQTKTMLIKIRVKHHLETYPDDIQVYRIMHIYFLVSESLAEGVDPEQLPFAQLRLHLLLFDTLDPEVGEGGPHVLVVDEDSADSLVAVRPHQVVRVGQVRMVHGHTACLQLGKFR